MIFQYPHFHNLALYRNLEISSDSQSADLTDEELNRILRLLINNRKAEPVAEELRRIGSGRRFSGRGSSGGKTEGQTVGYYRSYELSSDKTFFEQFFANQITVP
jgi:hypothetical protein